MENLIELKKSPSHSIQMEVENYCHFYTMHTKIRQCGRRKAGRTSVLYFAAETKKLGNTLQGLKITLKVSFYKSRAETKQRRLPMYVIEL